MSFEKFSQAGLLSVPKAAEDCRTPKRGRPCEHTLRACVLECGGAPPLFERIMRGHGTAQDVDQRPSYERRIFKVRQSRYKRQFVQEYGQSADRRQRLQKFGVEIDPRAGEGD
jgi:hypothetical protein